MPGGARRAGGRATGDERHAAIRAGYDAFNAGRLDEAVAHLSAEVEWVEPESFPAGGRYAGRAGAREYLRRVREHWAEVESVPERVVDAGERVVVVVRARVRAHGERRWREDVVADVYTYRDGEVVRMEAFASPAAALAAVGAAPHAVDG